MTYPHVTPSPDDWDQIRTEQCERYAAMSEDRANQYVYGSPDRRLGDTDVSSRFRPRYRKLTDAEMLTHDEIKAQAEGMEVLFAGIPDGRYKSMAITALEEAVMWAVKGLTQ